MGKFNHAVFENHKSIPKLRQFIYQLNDAHALFVLFIKDGSYADLLRFLYVGNGIVGIFLLENSLNIMPVSRKAEQRKRVYGA